MNAHQPGSPSTPAPALIEYQSRAALPSPRMTVTGSIAAPLMTVTTRSVLTAVPPDEEWVTFRVGARGAGVLSPAHLHVWRHTPTAWCDARCRIRR